MSRAAATAEKQPKSDIAGLSASARTAVQELANALESLRLRIANLSRQRAELNERPLSKADALARLDAWLGRERAQALDSLQIRKFVFPGGQGRDDILDFDSRHSAELWRGILAAEVRTAYVSALERFYSVGADGISDADRTRDLERLDKEIQEAEIAEESLIRDLEAMGCDVQRRSDASPAVVLAHDTDISPGARVGPSWQ